MYFYLIGIDYKSSAIDRREEFYRNRKAISGFWASRAPYEAAVLVTCNRIEIYGVARCADDAFGHIAAFSKSFPNFSKYAYLKFTEAQVFRHALRLASGLESQINGELEILTQLNLWKVNSELPFPLEVLWDKAIFLSQKIRLESKLNEGNVNIATLVFNDIEKRLKRKERYEIIIIGTGKVADVFAKYRPSGTQLTFVAHKNYQKAKTLAKHSGAEALPLESLPRIMAKADVLIGATSSPHYVLKKEDFDKYPLRREDSLYIYDLAAPRDVEPAVGDIDGVYLYNLDSLGYLFAQHNKLLRPCIESASFLIEDALGVYQEVIHDKSC